MYMPGAICLEKRMDELKMRPVASIKTDFGGKFGIPRQSGLAAGAKGEIIFAPEFRNPDAVRGLDGFSHIWLIWEFSENVRQSWSPTVRPPRLGGNTRMGVFATRSPFRPNPIGLSCVKLEGVELTPDRGPVLRVSGADIMDGTPILDIKPYIPYADSHPEAVGGFASSAPEERLDVRLAADASALPENKLETLRDVLSRDPRPRYQDEPGRIYGMSFAGCNVRFSVEGNTLTVTEITKE